MSVRLLGRAFYVTLPPHLKLTLLALCDEANDDGRGVFIGQKHLAEKTSANERTIRRHLDELREGRWIRRLPDKHPTYHTDQYEIAVARLPLDRPDRLSGRSDRPPVTGDRPDRTPSAADRSPASAPTGHRRPPTHERPVRSTRPFGEIPNPTDTIEQWPGTDAYYAAKEGLAGAPS